ncbi:MAG TPA: GNAT family N-acetyltransferase [Herpetosiphonaceae bacterium]
MIRDDFLLRSQRLLIRSWQRQDYHTMDTWPPFTEPLSAIWNLPDRVVVGEMDWGTSIRRTYAVALHDGALVGRITLRDIEPNNTSARLGITIGSPFVSQGYGTESMRCFLNEYFTGMRFKKMVLDVAAVNERAVRCYRRLGFQLTASHWRDAGHRFLSTLDPATVATIEPFIRRGRHTIWAQFYDMALPREQWLQQPNRHSLFSSPGS